MRLVDPVRGSVVEATDSRTVVTLLYGRGYWNVDDDQHPPEGDGPEKSASQHDDAQ